jgi:hypothetical protein
MDKIMASYQQDLVSGEKIIEEKLILEYETFLVSYQIDRYILIDVHNIGVRTFSVDDAFELFLDGRWQTVILKSGGYKGWYYVTASGERARLALGMRCRQLILVKVTVTIEMTTEKKKTKRERMRLFSQGDSLSLLIGDTWQIVRLENEGYQSLHYVTVTGKRGQLVSGTSVEDVPESSPV